MELSEEEIAGIGIALNEATLLGAEVDPSRALAALTFSVLSLPETGEPPADRRVSIVLSPVRRVAATLLTQCTRGVRPSEDSRATTTPFRIDQLLEVVQSFGGCPVYGWEFVDSDPEWEDRWSGRISLDWSVPGPVGLHTLNLFQDGPDRYLSLNIWFDALTITMPPGQEVDLASFIAGGRRWWDALYAGDPRTNDAGIFPLARPGGDKGPATAS